MSTYPYYRPTPPTSICTTCCCPTPLKLPVSGSQSAAVTSGNSVMLHSGQFVLGLPLLSASAIGVGGWGLGLKFLSGAGMQGLLGSNVDFTQNARLEELPGGNIVLHTGEHTTETFEFDGSTYHSENNNTAARLSRSGVGTASDCFTLVASSGNISRFFGFHASLAAPGRIQSLQDRHGNLQSFNWASVSGVVQLASITDSYGRTIQYRYYGPEQAGRLREIEDLVGRKLGFQYDADGRLVALVTPSIQKGAEGNTFPGGTAYVFQYDSSNPRPERRGDLVRIWYPNQATPFVDPATRTVDVAAVYAAAAGGSSARPRYEIAYGQDPTDLDHFGRVIRETVGDPAGGVGGTYQYAYTTDGLPSNLIDPGDPIVARTIMTDRNGNQSIYDFNLDHMVVRKEVIATRSKNSRQAASFITWTKYNAHNQPVLVSTFP